MRHKKFLLLVSIACAAALGGCASVPVQQKAGGVLSTYTLHGKSYIPLLRLSEAQHLGLDYDTFTRTVTLSSQFHRVTVKPGETMLLIDGRVEHSDSAPEMCDGTVVVPSELNSRLIALFTKQPAAGQPASRTLAVRLKKVVIDAGHGGKDPGAIGRSGLREKDVNLDIAKRLQKLLTDAGAEVVLTRSTDKFVELPRRVEIANASGAELFVSIHSNANRVRGMNGFEVYYVSPKVNDEARALISARQSKLHFDQGELAEESLSLRATLWDMLYRACRAESIVLARAMCRIIDRDMETRVLGVKGANYHVLKGVRMPAVLVEIGFVSNQKEEQLLRNTYYRQQVAEALAAGIREYARDYIIMEASR